MSLSSTTSDGAKRITSGPALSTITPSASGGVQEVARSALVLRLQLGANQQPHPADLAEHVVLLVNLLQVLHKQLALRANAV